MEFYDEAEIKSRLVGLDRLRKTAFAAACAERLWPLFERYSRVTGQGDVAALRAALDGVWKAAQGEEIVGLAEAQGVAEGMVPSDDAEWVLEMGYGQNAAAAVAYSARTWLTDDSQEGVWSARQVYEAADYAAQRSLLSLDLNASDSELQLLHSAPVQTALLGLAEDLIAVESAAGDRWDGLRRRACHEGVAWARSLP